MFNKIVLAGVVMTALAGAAHAADSVELKVKGTLVNAACDISLDKNEINVGTIPVKNLTYSESENAYWTQHYDATLSITCGAAMPVAFMTTDNNPDSRISVNSAVGVFGLGKTEAGDNIGVYTVFANKKPASVNGEEASVLYSTNSGSTWNGGTTGLTASPNDYYTVAKKGASTPEPLTTATIPLDVQIAFSKVMADKISDSQAFSGSTTFTLRYI
ncbi:DUF1120 domain-containing protein [Cronobacter sakazakii]|uniref:DUF1120 domain-containing protein n=1 Tax=Cronobacter sakazakii TaxID=28141 RepID=UPI000BEAD78A|nr:DUF1120 domain-containing protein [Cronobacter sakazakii]PUV47088.1 DUF1120 domain-containing protein [Cronobacter sakazakii]TWR36544.1 DUF1120 domain-containing protein [Cronobacter sakazakii]